MLLLVALSVSTVNVVNVFIFGFPHKKELEQSTASQIGYNVCE